MNTLRLFRLILLGLAGLSFDVAWLEAAPVDFLHQVRPILQRRCYACHAAEKQKSGYRLDIKSAAFKGGEIYGANIIPGNAAASLLIQFIADPKADLQMPPDERLSPAEIQILTDWVNSGGNWPDGVDVAQLEDRRDHWAFKPLQQIPARAETPPAWSRGRLDDFVFETLQQEGLSPAPPAAPVEWLRRVTFDLTGLPPTPNEVAAYQSELQATGDAAACAGRVVDRLLSSPGYGERCAQHWLDLVRYADTHGFEVNTERPYAWPYRDYVIASLNADLPYDKFIREQIAGDATGQETATGFLVTASVLLPAQIGADDVSKRLARQDAIDEIVTNIGQTFLGLSLGCARCHDHKFDPITQREYYAMQAFVAGVEYGDREIPRYVNGVRQPAAAELKRQLVVVENELQQLVLKSQSGVTRTPVNAGLNVDRFNPVQTQRLRFVIQATNSLEPCLDELEVFNVAGDNVALASAGTQVTASGSSESLNRHELRFVNDGQYGNSRSWMSNQTGQGWVELEFPENQTICRVVWGRDRQGKYSDRLAMDYRIEAFPAGEEALIVASSQDRAVFNSQTTRQPPFQAEDFDPAEQTRSEPLLLARHELTARIEAAHSHKAFSGVFRKPDIIRLLSRGDPEQPREEVVPAVPSVIGSLALAADAAERERRLALANWIASPSNPLTSRVIVNRIWQGHFGTGIVPSPNDFGRTGMPPSHPRLLDWLAAEFIRGGWSIKQLHRLIVLSATYAQSSRIDEEALAVDADCRFLWRYPARRLDAETIRDSMLACAGQLNRKMSGPGFDLFNKRGGLSGFAPVETFSGEHLRRMIYAHKVRRERDAVFGVFDLPDGGQSTSQRRESMTPMQALNLFNSSFTLEASKAFAGRLTVEAGPALEEQVRLAWRIALSRKPEADELKEASEVVSELGLETLCRVLFNSNEFLFYQ